MSKGVFITLVVCAFVLLLFIPLGKDYEIEEYSQFLQDPQIVLIEAKRPIDYINDILDDMWQGNTDPYKGNDSTSEDGQPPEVRIPDEIKFHSGISETAQAMNAEYYDLCKYYVYGTNIADEYKQGTLLFIMATTIMEQGNPVNDNQILVASIISQEDYKKDPNAIKLTWFGDMSRASGKFSPDPDPKSGTLGPHSAYKTSFADKQILAYVPFLETMGTSRGFVDPPRVTSWDYYKTDFAEFKAGSAVGNTANWYDSAQLTAGHLSWEWNNLTSETKKAMPSNNPYFMIMYNSVGLSHGSSMFTNGYRNGQRSGGEWATPEFYVDWCTILSQDWAVTKIREYLKEHKPPYYGSGAPIDTNLLRPLMVEAADRALKQNPNFFASSRYRVLDYDYNIDHNGNAISNPSLRSQTGGNYWTGTRKNGAGGAVKISYPARALIQAMILEERLNGAY